MKFYGTMLCKDTVYADKVLRKNGIDIEYVDITASMSNLKEFLALRDLRDEFKPIKESGKAGVPVFLLDDGKITFDVYELENVTKRVESEETEKEESGFQGCAF